MYEIEISALEPDDRVMVAPAYAHGSLNFDQMTLEKPWRAGSIISVNHTPNEVPDSGYLRFGPAISGCREPIPYSHRIDNSFLIKNGWRPSFPIEALHPANIAERGASVFATWFDSLARGPMVVVQVADGALTIVRVRNKNGFFLEITVDKSAKITCAGRPGIMYYSNP